MSETKQAPAVNGKSPKSSPSKKEIDTATAALNHFAQGKRHLLVNDINSAVNSLQEACRLLAEQHGETAPECGDAYFYYGRALLELSRIESGVLGNALDGEQSGEEDAEDGEEEDGETEEGEGGEESQEGEESQTNGEQTQEEGEKTDDEEISNLQLSWEMLELAKVIFKKQEEKTDMPMKVAQVCLKLGEVGLESENYSQSIEDFKECLTIQESSLKADDRCLAETNYQLGIAYSFSDDFDNAISSFKSAVNVIETKITNLINTKKEKEGWTDEQKKKYAEECSDPFYTEQGEIDELNQLLPEMKEKIVDMEQMKKDSKEKLVKLAKQSASLAATIGGVSSSSSSSSNTNGASTSQTSNAFGESTTNGDAKPIKNISHLIRKKRKPEEEVTPEDTKKAKGENGEAVTSPTQKTAEEANGKTEDKTDDKKESTEAMETSESAPTAEELKKKIADEKKETEKVAA